MQIFELIHQVSIPALSLQQLDVELVYSPGYRRHRSREGKRAGRYLPFCLQDEAKLLRNHADRPQPRLYPLRPVRYRELRAPQPKRMPAFGKQMHLHRNPGVLERDVVRQRLVYAVHFVILGLYQKSGGVCRVTGTFGFNP